MFTMTQEFTEKYCGFRGSLFSVHPLSGCERLPKASVYRYLSETPSAPSATTE